MKRSNNQLFRLIFGLIKNKSFSSSFLVVIFTFTDSYKGCRSSDLYHPNHDLHDRTFLKFVIVVLLSYRLSLSPSFSFTPSTYLFNYCSIYISVYLSIYLSVFTSLTIRSKRTNNPIHFLNELEVIRYKKLGLEILNIS